MDDRRQLIIRLCAALYASKRYTGSKFDALTGYGTQALISHAHSPASRLSYVDEVCVYSHRLQVPANIFRYSVDC